MKRFAIVTIVAFVLAGCTATISANAKQGEVTTVTSNISVTDMTIEALNIVPASNLEPKIGTPPFLSQDQVDEVKRIEEKRRQLILKGIRDAEIERTKQNNTIALAEMVKELRKHIGTPYVFSGTNPSGWDCSGLVRWFYLGLGVELEHRASKQLLAGEVTAEPTRGDIVVFRYKSSGSAYHVGIYLSENQMLHAGGGKGDRTAVASIEAFAGNYSDVLYVKVLNT